MDIQSSSRLTRPDARPAPVDAPRGAGATAPSRGVGNAPSAHPQPLGVPERAPRETPSLWHLLTELERAFFQMPGRGPLSYGPNAPADSAGEPTIPGGRLDVRG